MPLAIDLFCGLGGWTEGLLAEGWSVIGFDIEEHVYGEHRYPAKLLLYDVCDLHGSRLMVQGRGPDRCLASVSGVQLHGDAVVQGEGQGCGDPRRHHGCRAGAPDAAVQRVLSHPARGVRGGRMIDLTIHRTRDEHATITPRTPKATVWLSEKIILLVELDKPVTLSLDGANEIDELARADGLTTERL
jgi:hypothetical protein